MRAASGGLTLLALFSACGGSEVAPAEPKPESPARPAASAPAAAPHAPTPAPTGEYFRLEELIGRQIDALHPSTCKAAAGWELESALSIEGRALAVRRCAGFRGPHDVLEGSSAAGSLLTVISDGGRIVFAVASKEYALEPAQRVGEKLLRELALTGCEQVYSDEHNIGFTGCPGAAGWVAVTRLTLAKDGGTEHAVVLEVAQDRATAGQIARAYAQIVEQR